MPVSKLKVADIDCPRCHKGFTCNAADIKQCQCWGVELGVDDFSYLQQQGFSALQTGCLCRDCLLEIQIEVRSIAKKS
ncbi:MAG: cysteine-rich CWC family protein [Oleispira sp.]|nr:cysteine-rich CWC family protein [Oleispira sp.]